MSSYFRKTKNPKTGEFEDAIWADDHYGKHKYGVMFSDGTYKESDHKWEFEDERKNPLLHSED